MFCALLLLSTNISHAYDQAIEPTDSWVYRSLNTLNLFSPPGYFANQKPYWRDAIADYLVKVAGEPAQGSSPVREWELERLRAEIGAPLSASSLDRIPLRLKFTPYSLNYVIDHSLPLYRIGLKGEASLTYDRAFSVIVRGRLENKGELDSYALLRKWKKKLTGYFDYALLSWKYKSLTVGMGRSFRVYGPHDNDRLLVSANSPAFDQFFLNFTRRRFAFQYWTTQLDRFTDSLGQPINRYFAVHRLALKPHRRFELGLSETALYGRVGSTWELRYFNPLLPYYWEQYNHWIDDNVYFGVDFNWFPRPGLAVYGELLIDDFQIDFVSEPQQVGFNLGLTELGLVGSRKLQLDVDYTQIRKYVYGQNKFYNVFTNYGVVIGSSLGPDSDRLRYGARYYLNRLVQIALQGMYKRRGEGRYNDPQTWIVPKGDKFPSGRIERTLDHCLEVRVMAGTTLEGQLLAGYLNIGNVDNQTRNFHSPYLSLNLYYHFKQLLLL